MRAIGIRWAVFLLLAIAARLPAQVLTVYEVRDPAARLLQQRYMKELNEIGGDVQAHQFPYSFYLSRQLDIDERQQLKADRRSIRFDNFQGQVTLEITGNYYAAYSEALMDKRARAKKTYEDVVLPVLKIAVPKFLPDDDFAAFAVEVSHHVRRRLMTVETENAENLVFVFSRASAYRLVTATTEEQQQAALLEGKIYLDAEPFLLWLKGEPPAEVVAKSSLAKPKAEPAEKTAPAAPEASASASAPNPTVSPALLKAPALPARLITPDTLAHLKTVHQDSIARLTADLDKQAHFVSYAPPDFVAFHQGAYLQLSLSSPLSTNHGSRYQLAALAFDDHIAHLIRPVLAYFPQDGDFDGIDFSTTIRLPNGGNSEAVEFFFPFSTLRCFANYDCTGQQLIDGGIVLINGERASLNLAAAEAVAGEPAPGQDFHPLKTGAFLRRTISLPI
jgi:hypothetical protein